MIQRKVYNGIKESAEAAGQLIEDQIIKMSCVREWEFHIYKQVIELFIIWTLKYLLENNCLM